MTPTILVADDNAALLTLLRLGLESVGFAVVTATDGEEAARLALERVPAAVVLDLLMPKLDGLSVLARMRGRAATRDVPVLVITGMPGSEGARLAQAYGAAYVLPKPFRLEDVVERLRAALAAPVGR